MCTWQDYAWAKQGMVFPFLEFMDRFVSVCVILVVFLPARIFGSLLLILRIFLFRFQGHTRLYKTKESDFHKAMEEALLADNGILDPHYRAEQIVEGATSCAEQEYHCQGQVILIFPLRVVYDHDS
jgi:hypothetical protein